MSAAALISATHAQAAVTILSAATATMICSGGICAPTAKSAVLNVGDLETLLASGNVTVTTTGTGVQANDIDVKAALGWSSSGALSLLANKSIAIDNPVSISGLSGLTLQTDGKNGTLSFGKKGNVSFANLSSQLTIDGTAYTLVGNITTLAMDIAANPSDAFALAASYDAGGDGAYTTSPIGTVFTGTFEGLGNAISNLTVAGGTNVNGEEIEGLFAEVGLNGTVRNVGLTNANILVPGAANVGGGLAGANLGVIDFCYTSGTVAGEKGKQNTGPFEGGLIGENGGTVENSYSTASVTGLERSAVGGLVGVANDEIIIASYATGEVSGNIVGGLVGDSNGGAIADSYATGNVKIAKYKFYGNVGGGLVGIDESGAINDSYATGAVHGTSGSEAGGLVGGNGAAINFSYSTGAVTGGAGSIVGGLIGDDGSPPGSLTDTYWDTDTSGITNLSQGAGNIANDPGIAGLTTAQFQSGLPAGFDPTVWAEKSRIDDGFPYLLANKPGK